jgi:hypothetical protein
MQHLNQLIEEIRRLSSKDRRRLFRHAQLVGLLDLEDLLTDRDALRIVPAVPPTRPTPVTAPVTASVDAPKPAPPRSSLNRSARPPRR